MAKETLKTVSRSAAVVKVLKTSRKPQTVGQVTEKLEKAGRTDVVNIHQTLSNLQKRGAVVNVERGLWTVAA